MADKREIDLTGLKCPMPIVELTKLMRSLPAGEEVTAFAEDPAFCLDVKAWCNKTGHHLVRLDDSGAQYVAVVRKNTGRN